MFLRLRLGRRTLSLLRLTPCKIPAEFEQMPNFSKSIVLSVGKFNNGYDCRLILRPKRSQKERYKVPPTGFHIASQYCARPFGLNIRDFQPRCRYFSDL